MLIGDMISDVSVLSYLIEPADIVQGQNDAYQDGYQDGDNGGDMGGGDDGGGGDF